MSPDFNSSQIFVSLLSLFSTLYVPHSSRFMCRRAPLTSLATTHDTGATWLYHGHFVRFEWQSWHDRCKISDTSAGTPFPASSVFPPSTAGFVFPTGIN